MHDFPLFYSPYGSGFFAAFLPFLVIAALWTVVLKGISLWYAARANQKWWFVALLIINTLGVLEIVYLIWFRPKTTDVHSHHDHAHHDHHHPAHHSSAPGA